MSHEHLIDWTSMESHMWLNPKLPRESVLGLDLAQMPQLPGHIWVASSGSTGGLKIFGLSKTAFLISAEAVNAHLKVKKADIWLNVLPIFHVGGLSIWARAYLSRSKVIDRGFDVWSPEKFHIWVKESNATLTSLVPTQVYDLVELGRPAPLALRAIVVGGAALDSELYRRARALGYRVLPSYGMTECCSQLATAEIASLDDPQYNFPQLKILSHVEVKNDNDRLAIRSAALFTAQVNWVTGESSPRAEVLRRVGEWYYTQDIVQVNGAYLRPEGRADEQVKISGELVSLPRVRERWAQLYQKVAQNYAGQSWALLSQPHARRGVELVLVLPTGLRQFAQEWLKIYNEQSPALERINCVYAIDRIPQTALGKINYGEIKKNLSLD